MVIAPSALYETLEGDLVDRFGTSILEPIAPEESGVRFAAKTLLSTLLKKCVTETDPNADRNALDMFLASDRKCREWSLQINSMHDEYLIGEFRQCINQVFDELLVDDLVTIGDIGECGPGASVGANGDDFYTKLFSGPLTSTRAVLHRAYLSSISSQPHWLLAEKNREDQFGSVSMVEGSRLAFVPKRNDISRVICVEPVLNMYFQKGYGRLLERLINKRFGIDLATQPDINGELAKEGSQTGRFSTIDLSSASDSISLKMLEHFLPRHVLAVLKMLRSPSTQLPDGSWLELSMISSMGNGFTFPLETLIFSCAVSAVYRLNSRPLLRNRVLSRGGLVRGNFGVFGDDIIVETDLANQVIHLLAMLGFSTNTDKTFTEGSFRESCGCDFLNGYPVRGVYIKSLESQASRYVAFNRLMAWSARHSVMLPDTLELLGRSVQRVLVPLHENDDAGLKIPIFNTPRKRWDAERFAFRYKPFVARTPKIHIKEFEFVQPRKAKRRILNPEGALIAFLGGYISTSKKDQWINLRVKDPLYSRRQKLTSSWDFLLDESDFGLEQLYAVAEGNLVWLSR